MIANESVHNLARYHRQTIFPPLGIDGQQHLLAANAVLVGCGATGTALANLLARAGVGTLRIIDRDYIELNNLQRQFLFDEEDIKANLPKSEAAARKLRRINSDIDIESVVADVNAGNVLGFLADATVVLDGTDNFSTRFLLNDACIKLGLPWIYTGVIASYGMTSTFMPEGAPEKVPGERVVTGCLRCLLTEIPAPGTTPTCDTAGVLGPVVSLLSAISASEAIKIIIGRGRLNPGVIHMDLWSHEYEQFGGLKRRADCPACVQHRYEYLDATMGTATTSLCGRNAVQVTVHGTDRLDLAQIERQLVSVADRVDRNAYLLRAQIDGFELTLFPDNRAIIKGTEDEDLAKSIYARYIGM